MFVVFSDVHLTENRPEKRTDSLWMEVVFKKLRHVCRWARAEGVSDVIVAGDFFDRSSHSAELVNKTFDFFTKFKDLYFHIVPGNHDVRFHNITLLSKSQIYGLGCLENVEIIASPTQKKISDIFVDMYPYGSQLGSARTKDSQIAVIHEFAYSSKPWATAPQSGSYKRLIKRLGNYEVVIAGDNHDDFMATYRQCRFLNCGGFVRQKITECDRKPKFYFLHRRGKKDIEILPVEIPISSAVWDFKKKARENEREEAIFQAAESLGGEGDLDINFVSNLRRRVIESDVNKKVKEIITKEIESYVE